MAWNNRSAARHAAQMTMESSLSTETAVRNRVVGALPSVRRSGDQWILVFAGQACEVDDDRAVRLLATLIAQPGEEISALALEQSLLPTRGGRAAQRQLHDARERACAAVTQAIEDGLAAIAGQHPALARHLRASLRIGVLCRYEPGEGC